MPLPEQVKKQLWQMQLTLLTKQKIIYNDNINSYSYTDSYSAIH
jgi:hypothetical protein